MFENKGNGKTSLSEFGEFALINYLTKDLKNYQKTTILGVGDDAAVLQSDSKKQTLVSTDMLVEGVHFNLTYMSLKHLGYKAVVVNLSDIYAMNGNAKQITVSLALSNRFLVEDLEEFYLGIRLAAETYGVDIVGGDTTSSSKGLIISVTAVGEVSPEKITLRKGASEGDLIVVTGDLGGAYLGFQVLERERQIFEVNPNNQPDLEPHTYLIERQIKPEARKDIPPLLEALGVVPTSMIDISDGLSSELLHICHASEMGCQLYEEKIPIDPQVLTTSESFNLHPVTICLNGGEDYELLFTIKQKDYPKIKGNPNLTVVGYITSKNEGANLVSRIGELIPLKAQGWDSFSGKEV
ncbi:thiamine-monophosphate kinase [Elysia marginata]|uniref:Thiamine-monophosphate kinase n=1 Tax=Elysia marginata TaxID=1093978 RepID=A0AAV4FM26_9GAST|nr:thiamine-monophosphate kinase [Elysia marginata]